MLRKKITLCLLILLVCTQLTGCVLTELASCVSKTVTGVENFKQGIAGDSLRNTIDNDNRLAMSASTKKKQEKVVAWQNFAEKSANIAASLPFPRNIPVAIFSKIPAAFSASSQQKYDDAKASDNTYQASKKRMEESESNTRANKIRSFLPFIVAALLLIAALVFIFMLKKKSKQVIEEEPVPDVNSIQQPEVVNATLVGRDDEKSIEQCKKYCKKFDIDYESSLQQYAGGDPKKFLDLLVCSVKEDFHKKE